MLHEKIDLYDYFKISKLKGQVGTLISIACLNSPEMDMKRKRPAMIVIGGGGYAFVSDREKEPVAIKFLAKNFNVFILDYSVAPINYPSQIIEGAMAIRYIRENAEKFAIDPDHVAVVGFSAGGHLACCLGTIFDDENIIKTLGGKEEDYRPNAQILAYPVITSGIKSHYESLANLLGDKKDLLINAMSLETRVNSKTVPAFIWSTFEDGLVPCENSLLYATSLKKNDIPFELHIYENGQHGLSIAERETNMVEEAVSSWVELSCKWLAKRGFKI